MTTRTADPFCGAALHELVLDGGDVIEAEDGKEGVESACSSKPDVILMDMRMPVMTGLEAVSRIREVQKLKDTVIFGFSASVFESDKEDCLHSGCNGFISKPLVVGQLFSELHSHLGIEWVYAGTEENGTVQEPMQEEDIFRHLPPSPEEIVILYDLVRQGNMRAIMDRASYLEALDAKYLPFAGVLQKLAQNFEEQKILTMIEVYNDKGVG